MHTYTWRSRSLPSSDPRHKCLSTSYESQSRTITTTITVTKTTDACCCLLEQALIPPSPR
jgi:hypothetical protein